MRGAGAALACALGLLPVSVPAEAQPGGECPALRLEHRAPLQPGAAPAKALREISALAWDADAQELVAVTDRGWLLRVALQDSAVGLHAEVRSARLLSAAHDAESAAWRPSRGARAAQLWVNPERSDHALQLGADGERLATHAWPAAARGLSVEGMAWHDELGLLLAPHKPRRWFDDGRPSMHALVAEGGRLWAFAPSGKDSRVKAIEPLPGDRLLVLERIERPRAAGTARVFSTRLRLLALSPCGERVLCQAPELPLQPALADGPDNFEGLACAPDGRCWLAADSGPAGTSALLVQLRFGVRP